MSHRIRQLEDALAFLQLNISSETHPLLLDELLSIKFGPEIRQAKGAQVSEDLITETMDAFGTLAIGEDGV